ncbi:hypothetical protein N9M90_02325 [Alphaproteobacteria bacterium]|nr:hypothetical protein [Alphaproteobacteria bacterium]
MSVMNIILYQDKLRGATREANYQNYARPKVGNEKPAFFQNVVLYDFLSDYA